MAETYQRQSPLAHLHLAAMGERQSDGNDAVMREHAHRTMVTVRGNANEAGFRSAVEKTVGIAPPVKALSVAIKGQRTILWMGPDEWLIVAPAGQRESLPAKLSRALAPLHAAAVEVGESMTVIELSGPRARDVIAKGCTIDLHPSVFGSGTVVRTLVAKTGVILHQTNRTPSFEIYVHRSFADYTWRWLADACLEYGAVD